MNMEGNLLGKNKLNSRRGEGTEGHEGGEYDQGTLHMYENVTTKPTILHN
jgi:hypothetical protein